MLSYRHMYHAGNFADVFKHALLTRLVIALAAKDKPFLYLDTHAGIGRYDLRHSWAQKAREYENGIARVWKAKDAPPEIQPYLRRIHEDARTKRLPKIEVDVTKLTFVNSSAIRLFVDWAMWVNEPTGAPYKLVFRTRDGVAWQRLTLTALKSIAPSAIEVEVEA